LVHHSCLPEISQVCELPSYRSGSYTPVRKRITISSVVQPGRSRHLSSAVSTATEFFSLANRLDLQCPLRSTLTRRRSSPDQRWTAQQVLELFPNSAQPSIRNGARAQPRSSNRLCSKDRLLSPRASYVRASQLNTSFIAPSVMAATSTFVLYV